MFIYVWVQDGYVHIYDLQSGEWISSFQAASGMTSSWYHFGSNFLSANKNTLQVVYLEGMSLTW